MKVLIAEDENISRRKLEAVLAKWGYSVVSCTNGREAWEILQRKETPKLAILDLMMPEMDGIEVCVNLRSINTQDPVYVILLTAHAEKDNIVKGLEAGANDYVVKPFDNNVLHARIRVGCRVLGLQEELSKRIMELQDSKELIKTLHGTLPICSYCKKIRDDKKYWHYVETYISKHSDADFSHSICPDCFEKHVKPELEQTARKYKK